MKFHATLDFPDDILFAQGTWTEPLLRAFIRNLAERKISAVHWIIVGNRDSGLLDRGSYLDRSDRVHDFIRRVPRPLQVVADEAHRNGMKCYGILKPFDQCASMPWLPLPAGEPHDPPTGLPYIGGEGQFCHRFIRENPSFRAELHPSLQEKSPRKPVRTIRLWHETATLPTTQLQILVSDNNRDFRPYTGPQKVSFCSRRRRPPVYVPAPEKAFGPEQVCACIEFSDLEISAPFIAIEFKEATALANTLAALAEVEDTNGDSVVFTFGLVPVLNFGENPDWRRDGIGFDAAKGSTIPGRGWTYMESGGRHRVEINQYGVVGIARGRNQYATGIVELGYPQTREWLVKMAAEAIDEGCDGIDMRLNSHSESLDWENYGFGPPIVNEFKRRHGIDITSQAFDRALWRRLRGENLDRMLDDVRDMLHRRGKSYSVQLSDNYDRRDDQISFFEMFFDWKGWISSGSLDGVNITKAPRHEPFYRTVVELCHQHNVPMIYTPSMFWAKDADWERDGPVLFDACEKDRLAAYNIYETASCLRLNGERFEELVPSMWRMVAERASS
jgi:hypothetical protein